MAIVKAVGDRVEYFDTSTVTVYVVMEDGTLFSKTVGGEHLYLKYPLSSEVVNYLESQIPTQAVPVPANPMLDIEGF